MAAAQGISSEPPKKDKPTRLHDEKMPMNAKMLDINDLSKEELIRLVGVFMGDVLVHHGMWFAEGVHSQGIEIALKKDETVLHKNRGVNNLILL